MTLLSNAPLHNQSNYAGYLGAKHRVGMAFICMLLASSSLANIARADTLAEAITMAYQHNPNLQKQRALTRANDETYVQARSGLGPNLSVGTSTSFTNEKINQYGALVSSNQPGFSVPSTTTLSVSLSQSIFTSGKIKSNIDAAEASVLSTQAQLASYEQQVLYNVINVYSAVRRDEEALKISQDSLKYNQNQLDQTKARFTVGELTKTDVAQAQAAVAQAQSSLAAAQGRLDSDRAIYKDVVGQAPTALSAEPEFNNIPKDFDGAMDVAEKQNPDLMAALLAERSASFRVKAARSAFGPTVNLVGQYSDYAPTSQFGSIKLRDYTGEVNVNLPLFTSGLNSSNVRAAAENDTAQQLGVEATRRDLLQNVSQAWANILSSRSSILANTENVRASAVAAEGTRNEYTAGLRTTFEVLNAQLTYENAQLALLDAKRSAYLAEAQLLVYMGQLSIGDFAPNVKTYDAAKHFKNIKQKGSTPIDLVTGALDAGGQAIVTSLSPKK